MLEKTTRMNFLFDFYQALLTDKQSEYISLYYLDDYSLAEIAEEYKVSRQAVYDNLKRTVIILEEYEEKLSLFKKFQEQQKQITHLCDVLQHNHWMNDEVKQIIEQLEKLE